MISTVIPSYGIGKERSDVNSIASIVVAAHIDALLAESAAERLARSAQTKSNRPNRVASAAKSVWSFLSGGYDGPATPILADYPYRG